MALRSEVAVFAAGLLSGCSSSPAAREPAEVREPRSDVLRLDGSAVIRGITIGPIESARHPDVGYGSAAYARQLDACKRMGATWISLTPFGRVGDLSGHGVDPTFETPYEVNFPRILTAIRMAHARGLKVMLVPEDRADTQRSVERLMGTKAEGRFDFIQERAEFANEELLDV